MQWSMCFQDIIKNLIKLDKNLIVKKKKGKYVTDVTTLECKIINLY